MPSIHHLPQQNASPAGLQRPSSIKRSDGEMDPRLYNDHLKPLAASEQNWSAYNFFALWMSVVHNVAGYMIAGTLFSLRLSSWQVLLCLLIGILFLELFCDLCSMPSQRTGIPFPVISRFAFGIRGANIPAVVCVILTTAWYSVQTYLASWSLVVVLLKFFPTLAPLNDLQQYGFLGLSLLGYIAFCAIWIMQMFLFFMGMNAIRRFTDWAGPAVYFVIVGLAVYLIAKAGIGNISLNLSAGEPLRFWESIPVMLSAIGISISSYAVALLNFGIFARYGKTFGAVRLGNFLGLPVNYLFFSVLTVVITSATKPVFGELITDPIDVMAKIDTWAAVLIGGITFVIATVGINVAANFTLPAFNLSNLSPQKISWRMGGMVTSISSFLILPWMWWSNPVVIHYTLGTLGALIGPFVGILLSAYYLVHRKQIRINALYSFDRCGPYWYWNGFNPNAIVSVLFAGLMAIAALVLPSLLSASKTADPSVKWISDMSFTVGLSLGAISFVLLENILPLLLNEMRAKGKENTNEIRLNQTN